MMNLLRIWWSDTRGKVVATLVLLWIATLIHSLQLPSFLFPVIAVAATCLFDGIVAKIRTGKWVVTMSSWVTGLLIGFLFDPTAPYWQLAVTCLTAVLGKQLLAAGNHRHVFNPAAFGLVVSTLLFGRDIAWWGAGGGIISIFIIVLGGAVALHQIRRLWMPIVFLTLYVLYFHSGFDGPTFLFAFIMLPEPITSVAGSWWTYGWPILVLFLTILQYQLHLFLADPILLALLGADAAGFLFVRRPWV